MTESIPWWALIVEVLYWMFCGYLLGNRTGYRRGQRDERLSVRFKPVPDETDHSHYMRHVLGLPAKKFGTTPKGDSYHYYTIEELMQCKPE